MGLENIARELYGLPPDEFTAARDAMALEAKNHGDPSLASDVKKLRRPTVGAWAVNLLVRESPGLLDELLQLGEAMRPAQAELAGPSLRQLAKDRHELVARMTAEGQRLTRNAGRPLSDSVVAELQATLEATIADARAAEKVRSGTLATTLSYSGFGIDVTAGPSARESPRNATTESRPRRLDQEVSEAKNQVRAKERRRQRAAAELERRHEARVEAEDRLTTLRRAEDQAHAELQAATHELREAEEARRRAEGSRGS